MPAARSPSPDARLPSAKPPCSLSSLKYTLVQEAARAPACGGGGCARPEQPPGVDAAQSLAEGYARACLADLLKAGGGTRPGVAVLAEGGWTVLLSVFPAPAPAAPGGPALS